MMIIQWIIDYFKEDPHKLLLWVGGTGGILYWINLFRYRPRVNINNLKEFYVRDNKITFEAENLGEKNTSIKETVKLKALTDKRKVYIGQLKITSEDRTLASCAPKILEAEIEPDIKLLSLFYKTYRFSFTRGSSKKYYIQSADEIRLPFYKYHLDKIRFKHFGQHPWVKK